MKTHKVILWPSLLFFLAIASSCTQSTERVATPSIASPTRTPTAIRIVTDKPIATNTPIAVPTLPVEDARKRLLDLLANNSGCRLPCLWGITPGKSSYQEARTILMPFTGIAETAYFDYTPYPEDDISPLYVEGDLRLNTRVLYLYGDDSTVSLIAFRALEEKITTDSNGNWISKQPIFDSITFGKRIEYYSLSHVLSEQGIPASVMIRISGFPNFSRLLDIALLYPDQGIWVNYTMSIYKLDGTERGCPATAHIEMNLFPTGNPDSFFSSLEKTNWRITKTGYKPLEEATSMSVEQFYRTFRNPTNKCIETPSKLWSTPESGGG